MATKKRIFSFLKTTDQIHFLGVGQLDWSVENIFPRPQYVTVYVVIGYIPLVENISFSNS